MYGRISKRIECRDMQRNISKEWMEPTFFEIIYSLILKTHACHLNSVISYFLFQGLYLQIISDCFHLFVSLFWSFLLYHSLKHCAVMEQVVGHWRWPLIWAFFRLHIKSEVYDWRSNHMRSFLMKFLYLIPKFPRLIFRRSGIAIAL